VLGGANFYERREVRSLLAYLRLAAGRGDGDDVERCINAPFRFLGRAFVERVVDRAQEAHRGGEKLDWLEIVRKVAKEAGIQTRQKRSAEEWANLVHGAADQVAGKPCACTSGVSAPGFRRHPSRPPVDFDECVVCGGTGVETVSPATILRQITRMTGYIQWLKDDEGDESVENDRASNVAALTEVVAPRFQTTAELLDYIEQTQQKVAAERKNAGKDDKVILTSCHRAKGLEWPVVFLAGVSAGQFPHAMAEDVEEEKRLFYVGLTRARDYLHVSATSIGVSGREAGASLFLDAVGLV
jgi:DNA helicase-2/ATP-dependent DNA helicase PcrA